MLWHRQVIFESKRDNIFSFAEYRIQNWEVIDTKSPANWMPSYKPTALSRIQQNLELDSPPLWWMSIQPIWLHCRLDFAPGSGDIHVYLPRSLRIHSIAYLNTYIHTHTHTHIHMHMHMHMNMHIHIHAHAQILLVTPCLLTRIREFIHTQHRNTTRGRRPSVVLRC